MPNLVSSAVREGLYTHVVGCRILYYPELGSTMDEAARLAGEGADEGTVVIAEVQTAGRGRQGRSWVSQPGNLLLSVLLRPDLAQLPYISIIGGLATARAVRKTTGLNARIKWPNDLMLGGRKAAGVLSESSVEGQSVCYAVLGIGVNVALNTAESQDIAALATSIDEAAGEAIPREKLLAQLLMDLDDLYRSLPLSGARAPSSAMEGPGSVMEEWKGLLDTIGNRVTASFHDEKFSGEAVGVDDTGNLLLRTDGGDLITLTAGDVTLSR